MLSKCEQTSGEHHEHPELLEAGVPRGLVWGHYGSISTRSAVPRQVNRQLVSMDGDGLSRGTT